MVDEEGGREGGRGGGGCMALAVVDEGPFCVIDWEYSEAVRAGSRHCGSRRVEECSGLQIGAPTYELCRGGIWLRGTRESMIFTVPS